MANKGVAFIIDCTNGSSFDNVVFSGYIGIQGGGDVFTSAIRDSKFIGPGTLRAPPASRRFLAARREYAALPTTMSQPSAAIAGSPLIRSTFTHNHIGLQAGRESDSYY
jgi:hypothetical protein